MHISKKTNAIFAITCVTITAVLFSYFVHTSYKSDRSDKAYTSDTPVFSSSISPVIPLGISVAEAKELPQGISLIESNIEITGPGGVRMNEMVDIGLVAPGDTTYSTYKSDTFDRSDRSGYSLVVQPKDAQAFKPGKYSVTADIQTAKGIRHITQDFLWGVLAINPNKAIYRPGETAKLALAVLDERGMMVCDASVKLQVRKSESQKVESLTTENGRIRVNPECRIKAYTTRPDYETEYTVTDPGIYQMTLTAVTKNGTYTIEDWFEVRDRSDTSYRSDNEAFFDIERITATRIYPVEEYEVRIRVTLEEDFKGKVREQVPSHFDIKNFQFPISNFQIISNDQNPKIVEWTVDWKAHQTYELSYTYKSPEISPQFYLLGPLEFFTDEEEHTPTFGHPSQEGNTESPLLRRGAGVGIFREGRQWQVAVDAVEFLDTFTEAVDIVLTSHTPDTGGGWTQLIENPDNCELWINADSTGADTIAAFESGTGGAAGAGGCETASEGTLYRTNSTMSSADYTVEATQQDGDTADDTNTLACRIQDADNMYAVRFNEDDADLYERVGGTWSTIDTGTAGIADASVVTLSCIGSTISVLDDGVEILSATDTSHASAGYAGVGMGELMVAEDDMSSQNLDDFTVTTIISDNTPTITSVTDTPDPTTALRSTITFSTDWSDPNGDTIKAKICKTNSLTSQNCDGGYWATSSAFTATDPEVHTYSVEGSAVGSQSYYAFVCDDDGNCSSSTSGTFTVNPTTIPNVKFR